MAKNSTTHILFLWENISKYQQYSKLELFGSLSQFKNSNLKGKFINIFIIKNSENRYEFATTKWYLVSFEI